MNSATTNNNKIDFDALRTIEDFEAAIAQLRYGRDALSLLEGIYANLEPDAPGVQDLIDELNLISANSYADEKAEQAAKAPAPEKAETVETAVADAAATEDTAAEQAAPVISKMGAVVRGWEKTVAMDTFPHFKCRMTKDGPVPSALLSTIDNVKWMLEAYGVTCQYNEMRKRIDYVIPGKVFTEDNAENVSIAHIKSQARLNSVPVTELNEYLLAIGEENLTHPVREWIASKEWDGVPRMQSLIETLKVEPHLEAYRNALVRRWLISAVAAAFSTNPADKFELVLVLQGGQGIGKTTFFKKLCPLHAAIRDGFCLDPDEKDSVKQFNSHWIVELGELEGVFRKADIAKLKAFLSRTDDELRLPYKPCESHYKRRTVAGASVNPDKFLTDTTGNRRWGSLPVVAVDRGFTTDIQQVWAEVYELYAAGEQWYLNEEESEMLNAVNKDHEAVDPVEELVDTAFVFNAMPAQLELVGGGKPSKVDGSIKLNASQVAQGLGMRVDKKTVNEVADVLRKRLGPPKRDGRHGQHWTLVPRNRAQWSAVANG